MKPFNLREHKETITSTNTIITNPLVNQKEPIMSNEKNLKTLDEHNAERSNDYKNMFDHSAKPNGIACPMCSTELMDTNPMMTLTSIPPKKDIHCTHCGYRGYRLA